MDNSVEKSFDAQSSATRMIPTQLIEHLLKAHSYSSVLSGQASLPTLLRQLLASYLSLEHLLYIPAEGRDNFKLYSFIDSGAGYASLYQQIRRYLTMPQQERQQNVALLLNQLNEPGAEEDCDPSSLWMCYPLARLHQGWVLLEVEQSQEMLAKAMLQLIELRLLELSSERQLRTNNQQLQHTQQTLAFQQILIDWFERALEQVSLNQSCTELMVSLRQQHPNWAFYLLDKDGQVFADTPEIESYSQWLPLCRELDRYHRPQLKELWIDSPGLKRLLSEQSLDISAVPASNGLDQFHWLALPLLRSNTQLGTLVAWSPNVRLHQIDRQHFVEAGNWLANLLQIRQQQAPQPPTPPVAHNASELKSTDDELQPVQLVLAQLELVIAHLRRHPHHHYALYYLGLNQLEEIAKQTDEQTAFALYQEVGRRLRGCLRPNDLLCQYQEQDFVILVDSIQEPHDAEEIVLRLLELFQSQFLIGNHQLTMSCYIGIGLLTSSQPAKQQLHRVRAAMQTARQQQLGAYLFADEIGINRGTLPQEEAIRRALSQGQIIPFFQPVVRLKDSQLVGFEVVARWRNDNLGGEEATGFITTAERSGLVVHLDYEMLRQGYRQLCQWLGNKRPASPLTLILNLSGRHLSSSSAMAQLLEVAEEVQQEFPALGFEFSERDCMRYNSNALQALQLARDAGIRIGLDDFGTGHSSLKSLFHFPIDYIKVDQSFTQNMLNSNRNLALVRAIRDISHDLGFEVVVEGIETDQQYQKLESLGCEFGQGYFIAPPLSAAEAVKLLEGKYP